MKRAFTLSEVLITMGIIGIVATMTLPTIIQNYQKQVLITEVKQFYSIFNTALNKFLYDSGYATFEDSPLNDPALSQNEKKDYITEKFLKPYIRGKEINITHPYKLLAGNQTGRQTYDYMTNTGVLIGFEEGMWDSLQTVYFDVNGNKKPNRVGLDTFRIYIYEKPISLAAYKKLMDWDCTNCGDCCRPDLNPTATGWGCWIRILQENKINYY